MVVDVLSLDIISSLGNISWSLLAILLGISAISLEKLSSWIMTRAKQWQTSIENGINRLNWEISRFPPPPHDPNQAKKLDKLRKQRRDQERRNNQIKFWLQENPVQWTRWRIIATSLSIFFLLIASILGFLLKSSENIVILRYIDEITILGVNEPTLILVFLLFSISGWILFFVSISRLIISLARVIGLGFVH